MARRRIKRRKAKGPHLTAHRRAVARPEVRELLADLCLDWKSIDRIEKGKRLLDLAALGCSTRGLAPVLQTSATNIRRYMTFPTLSEREREAVRAGSSAKRILDRKAQTDRRGKMRERVSLDNQTGKLSDGLADTILAFCKTINGVPSTAVLEDELVFFLGETRNAAWQMEALGSPTVKLRKRLSLVQRFRKTRPQIEEGEMYLVHLSRWLAILLRSEMPERPIWERAIEKAGGRSKELRVRLTIRQHLALRKQKSLEMTEGPPPRREYSREAWRLGRQGPKKT